MKIYYIARMTLDNQSQTVVRLAHDLRTDPTLQEALDIVGLSETMDTLIQVSQQVELYDARRSEEQTQKKARTLALRKNAYSALQLFLDTVNNAIKLKKGDIAKHQEYLQVIEEIMVYTSGQVASCDTRRKNAKSNAAADVLTDSTLEKETQTSKTQKRDHGKSVLTGGAWFHQNSHK